MKVEAMVTTDAIKKLHTSTIDTRRAYEKAQQETQDPELKSLFGDMVALRNNAHGELHRVLVDMGEKPDEDGSFMTVVHKTVIAVRSAIKGVDRDSLPAFADGEDNILKEYDEALAQNDLPAETSSQLQRQKAAVTEKVREMRTLAS